MYKFTKFSQDSKPPSHKLNPSTPKKCKSILNTQSKQAQISKLDKKITNCAEHPTKGGNRKYKED
jgi:hypothetical protein